VVGTETPGSHLRVSKAKRHSENTCTFLFRFSADSSRCATVDVVCRIAASPNQCDWYPYRIIRAFGANAGSISSWTSQLTHRGVSFVPTFLHQLSSGWAPIPWIATMLRTVSILAGRHGVRRRTYSTVFRGSSAGSRSTLRPISSSVTGRAWPRQSWRASHLAVCSHNVLLLTIVRLKR
jgi:hypothetical protein